MARLREPNTETDGDTVPITYRPLDRLAPIETTCWGIRFEANVPKPVSRARTIDVPMPSTITIDGEQRTKHVEQPVPVIELAKGNPDFEVEGFPRAKRKMNTKRVVPPPGADWDDRHSDQLDDEAA
jgi:hypothetical protein